ncbi:hypothetical protein [Pseudomonas vancouverensis]|uniref:Bacterial Ig-like domain-containing protein n=1 Tax=Pseudomonas vancouverensis TaxID=95300 RepID=A0A1H2P9L4_PSEVA|nr:hypothetical protein [Pseudomonas vancouverensis]KAB0500163.1 hypothetical protein F7R09_03020 [Pseudomonas vancouverensis]TDB68652.1 hypothetical protein EIY72_01990 [Pseudomonas vancouverensis]SDV13696.1 hypothetical protein SAMN05216558_4052 [Pseudomonas vancouverensis]
MISERMEILPPPSSISPRSGGVGRGFTVGAMIPIPFFKCNIYFYELDGRLIRKVTTAPGWGPMLHGFDMPADLTTPGKNFYFRIQYQSVASIYSHWAQSGTLRMEDAPTLPMLRVTAPPAHSSHPEGIIEVKGDGVIPGAKVSYVETQTGVSGDAVVSGSSWHIARDWGKGFKSVYVNQTLGGISSIYVAANFRTDVAVPPPPEILMPQNGDELPEGKLLLAGSCLVGASVVFLTDDDGVLIANANVYDGFWNVDLDLGKGKYTIKAVQGFQGYPSAPSAPVTFNLIAAKSALLVDKDNS